MIGLRQKSAHITMVEHLGAQCFESCWMFLVICLEQVMGGF